MTNFYSVLSKNVFSFGEYDLVPIRHKDRFDIMEWRNQQIYHLRQKEALTKADQDRYFSEVISPSFIEGQPRQILFSLLKSKKCIGYGGLVHINWKEKSAEISFLIQTSLEKVHFSKYWHLFLNFIKEIAFETLKFNQLTVYSYELRPALYEILKSHEFVLDQRIKNSYSYRNKEVDILIHSLKSPAIFFREAIATDVNLLFEWVNEEESLSFSLNSEKVEWEDHQKWFKQKLRDHKTTFFIFQMKEALGQVRLDLVNGKYRISFSVDKKYRGKGIGSKMLAIVLLLNPGFNFFAEVLEQNKASRKIFSKLNFHPKNSFSGGGNEIIIYEKNEISRS